MGVATYGEQPQIIPSGQGGGHEWRILRALAIAKADGVTRLDAALQDLGRLTNRGSAAIIITASAETDWIPYLLSLAQLGIESTVILLDRTTFGGEGKVLAQRELIQQLGFACFTIVQGDIGQPVDSPAKKKAFQITPMGRVVAVAN